MSGLYTYRRMYSWNLSGRSALISMNPAQSINRWFRTALAGVICCTVSSCAGPTAVDSDLRPQALPEIDQTAYSEYRDGAFVVTAIRPSYLGTDKVRTVVPYSGPYAAGTLIVDTDARHLYLVNSNNTALRYAIGVGREGFEWSGEAIIGRKLAWPKWIPPAEMIARQPDLAPYRDGMSGGPGNPLGARALYLYQDGRDTLFRLHGTREPWSIGKQVSSGCIRLFNQDVIDLYNRVAVGARVIVLRHQPS